MIDAQVHYGRRIKADTESINGISHAKLLLQSHLGTLLAPETASQRGKKGGRGKKATSPPVVAFRPETLAIYRKIADHAERINEYAEKVTAANKEMSRRGGCLAHDARLRQEL